MANVMKRQDRQNKKQYLQPRSFFDEAIITDTGTRVIYCDATMQQMLINDYKSSVRGDYRFHGASEISITHEARKQAMRWMRYLRGQMTFSDELLVRPFIAPRCATCLGPILQTLQSCPAQNDLQPCTPPD